MRETRSHETEIEIGTTPEAVWEAITTRDGLCSWFAVDAEVTPGPQGSIWVSWGEGMQGRDRIEIWEPGRHLRTVTQPPDGVEPPPGATALTVDYLIEGRGGSTVLRIVHSGFGVDSAWDAEYEGTKQGWPVFVLNLKHYLERRAGEPCVSLAVYYIAPEATTAEQIWSRLTGPEGLALEGVKAGDPYRARAATGDEMSGTIDIFSPPRRFGASVDALGDGLLRLMVERMGGHTFVWCAILAYGVEREVAEGFRDRWQALLPTLAS